MAVQPADKGGKLLDAPTGTLTSISTTVNQSLADFFGWLGESLGHNPYRYILFTFVLTILCGFGLSDFKTESRSDKLWIPQNTESQKDQKRYTSVFESPFRVNNLIVESKSSPGSNILNKDGLTKFMNLHWDVEDLKTDDDDDLRSLCYQLAGDGHPCFVQSVLELWNYDKAVLAADTDVQATLATATTDRLNSYLGGYSVDSSSNVRSAKAMQITYFIENRATVEKGAEVDKPAEDWEEIFLVLAQAEDNTLTVHPLAGRSFSDEFGDAIGGDVILQSVGYLVIIIYLCINLGKCGDAVQSRVLLSLSSILAIGLGIVSSIGVSQLCGWTYTPVHTVLPFVLLGLGVDDSFVIVNALTQTDPTKPIPQRMREAMSHAGVSITVTSITDFVAFAISTTTQLPALASFCFYAATGILFLFFYQCIFFGAWVVCDARRQANRNVDCCPCICASRIESDDAKATRIEKQRELGSLSTFIKNKFAPFITGRIVGYFIIAFSLILVSVCSYGASELPVESSQLSFIPDNSYIQTTVDKTEEYFGDVGPTASIVTEKLDYFAKQQALFDIPTELAGKANLAPLVLGTTFVSWYHEYIAFAKNSLGAEVDSAGLLTDETFFYANLKVYLIGAGSRFSSDVVFDESSSALNNILAAKMSVQYDGKINNESELLVDAMLDLRAEVKTWGIGAYAYTFEFLDWETFIIIGKEMFQNVSLCLVAVFFVTLVLIAHPVTAFLVFIAVLFAVVEILGFMYFTGLVIDSVSVINLTLAVGLAVDYSAHVGHCFMLKNNGNNEERVIGSLTDIGSAVINGAFSTFLAVSVLGLSKSYVFRVLFIQFFFTCLLGVLNGLFFLPVLLKYFGPAPYALTVKATEIQKTEKV